VTVSESKAHDDALAALQAAADRVLTCARDLAALEHTPWAGAIEDAAERVQFEIRFYRKDRAARLADLAARAKEGK
jgi:hypothetical protein